MTPCYVFNADAFKDRVDMVKAALKGIPLVYSMKANPFLLFCLPDGISHVEVCSEGERAICQNLNLDPKKIIYSGVRKDIPDVGKAILMGADIITAESPLQVDMVQKMALSLKDSQSGNEPIRVILRLSSQNQFGMDISAIERIIEKRSIYPNIDFIGFHYYSGTAKTKMKVIDKDLTSLLSLVDSCREKYGYEAGLIEYGPGFAASYFDSDCEKTDRELLSEFAKTLEGRIEGFGGASFSIEMGRFLASSAGRYLTAVCDIKENFGDNYAIVDGGMHHINYYGQAMGMKVPPLKVFRGWNGISGDDITHSEPKASYSICGSLCTTADVLLRDARLPYLKVGDVIEFDRCGAYSPTEGISLFLSHPLPGVYIESGSDLTLVRSALDTYEINTPKDVKLWEEVKRDGS